MSLQFLIIIDLELFLASSGGIRNIELEIKNPKKIKIQQMNKNKS
jgi:hypothetical protein